LLTRRKDTRSMVIMSRNLVASLLLIFTAGTASAAPQASNTEPADTPASRDTDENTYDQASIISVTSDFLGAGSEAVAKVVEKVFSDLGRPNAYITGSEMSVAAFVGLRYGDGDLHHKIEGNR